MKNNCTAILSNPRATIRTIVDTHPAQGVILLAALTGAVQLYLRFWGFLDAIGTPAFLSLILPLVVGALLGIAFLYLFAWLYRLVGKWLGGQASVVEVRAALAWARVPILIVMIPCLVLFLIVPKFMVLKILFAIAAVSASVWAFVLTCRTLGEVHRFSSWRGFATLCIVNLLLVTPLAYMSVRVALLAPAMAQGKERAYQAAASQHLKQIVQATEYYKMYEGHYPETLDHLIDDGYLEESPYRTIFKKREYERYRYRFQDQGADSPFPIEVERMRKLKDLPKVLSYDGSGKILRDGQ